MSANALREAQKDWVVVYLLFRKISFRDGVAVITLAQIKEGRPCFAPPMHSESSYTYEVRRTSKGLIAMLIRSPAPPMSFDLKGFAMRYLWVKPNKSLDASGGRVFPNSLGAAKGAVIRAP